MKENSAIETIGSITKMEHLEDVVHAPLTNTLVLSNTTPFPGIKKQDLETRQKLISHFIILNYRYAPEKINRINSSLFKEIKMDRYPSYGEIIAGNKILPCIRLKKISSEKISDVQLYLKCMGLKMKAHEHFNALCQIKIFKSFKLLEMGNGIYRDLNNSNKFYLQISSDINWKRFDFIVKKIKYNLENPDFDAALGLIYRFFGPENVIRIYDENKTQQRILELRKWFISEIRKEVQISSMQ